MEEDDVLMRLHLLGHLVGLLILAQDEAHLCIPSQLPGICPRLPHSQPPVPALEASLARTHGMECTPGRPAGNLIMQYGLPALHEWHQCSKVDGGLALLVSKTSERPSSSCLYL